jgi:hypothetical protein
MESNGIIKYLNGISVCSNHYYSSHLCPSGLAASPVSPLLWAHLWLSLPDTRTVLH